MCYGISDSYMLSINTFTATVDLSRLNNSCLKSPALTLVDLIFQSRTLRSFSLNQLRDLSLYTEKLIQQLQYIWLTLSLSLL